MPVDGTLREPSGGRYFVQRGPGTEVTEDELRAWCAERLANYKVPREIVFVEEFPVTPAG